MKTKYRVIYEQFLPRNFLDSFEGRINENLHYRLLVGAIFGAFLDSFEGRINENLLMQLPPQLYPFFLDSFGGRIN